MNPGQLNQEVSGAQQQGQQLQSQYDQQAAQRVGDYNQAYSGAQNAQQNLSNFTGNMLNGDQMYGQNLASAQHMYGFDPTSLLKANQALANTETTFANLPQAVQQQGNYYGTTAGQEAANSAGQASNLNAVQQGQANAVNAFQNVLGATQNQANQQTTAGLTGQAQKLQGYQATAQNASQIMETARQTMGQIQTLQQNQGYLTAQQVSAYQNAYSNYVSAQAAAESASANMIQAQAQAALANQQVQMNAAAAAAAKNYPGGGGALNQAKTNVTNYLQSIGAQKPIGQANWNLSGLNLLNPEGALKEVVSLLGGLL